MLQEPGDASQQKHEETCQGLKKLIVKRRWAGMDHDEAELRRRLAPGECLAMEPAETD
jgi:hypothetical protein